MFSKIEAIAVTRALGKTQGEFLNPSYDRLYEACPEAERFRKYCLNDGFKNEDPR